MPMGSIGGHQVGWSDISKRGGDWRIVKSSFQHLLRACAGLCAKHGGVGVGELPRRKGPQTELEGKR